MDLRESTTCPLCGNPYWQSGKPCDICGAAEARIFNIPLGYVYPAEAARFKRIVYQALFLVILIGLLVYTIATMVIAA